MPKNNKFKNRLFRSHTGADFEVLAMEIFRYQAENNPVYAEFLSALNKRTEDVKGLLDIPFLPVSFFKSQRVMASGQEPEVIFSSSGTGGSRSRHYVADLAVYRNSFNAGFRHFYGPVKDYCVLALLPSYLEREGSSLVYMADQMIRASSDKDSGFYLNDFKALHDILRLKIQEGVKVLLLGVSFALLELAERFSLPENDVVIMETGGMKGRRKEMIRKEVHQIITGSLGVEQVHSEYGMTELLSQAYSSGQGRFRTPPWMKVLIRDTDDPFSYTEPGRTGGINVVDLANVDSCSFVETQDLGRWHENGEFEVMGRFDNSDIRGCNLLVI